MVTYTTLGAVGIAGFSNATVAYLKGLGYNATYQDESGSTSHVIVQDKKGVFTAANDPRKAAGAGLAF
jgi:gamma-glutamyltranspeptidase/glutathione hydrolase